MQNAKCKMQNRFASNSAFCILHFALKQNVPPFWSGTFIRTVQNLVPGRQALVEALLDQLLGLDLRDALDDGDLGDEAEKLIQKSLDKSRYLARAYIFFS